MTNVSNTTEKVKWPSVTTERPCPKCGKTNRCRIAPDGGAGICWRSGASEIWRDPSSKSNGQFHRPDPKPTPPKRTYISADAAIDAAGKSVKDGKLATVFTYPGDVARVARFNQPDGKKEFRPVHKTENGWCIGDPPGLWPLYRGDEIPADGTICIVEGEKCADAARSIGLPAVTSAHGAKSAHKSDWTTLAGKAGAIFPDADTAGGNYSDSVQAILHPLGCKIKIVRLPGLSDGGDIVDFISAGGTREQIDALVDAAPFVEPSEEPWPDPLPLPAGLPAVMPFNYDLLPESLHAWVKDIADRIREIAFAPGGQKLYILALAPLLHRGYSFHFGSEASRYLISLAFT